MVAHRSAPVQRSCGRSQVNRIDIAFREDESRARARASAANLVVLRRLALNLLKAERTAKVGIKNKRLKAGWDERYLLKVIAG